MPLKIHSVGISMSARRWVLLTGTAALVVGSAPTARAQSVDNADVLKRMERIELEVARLRNVEQENAQLKRRVNQLESRREPAPNEKRAPSGPVVANPNRTPEGAQAAYIPPPMGKAPGILYMRECPVYGPGFFFIPGTTGCIKVGGYVRLQGGTGASGDGIVTGADTMAGQGRRNRIDSNDVNYQARVAMSLDARFLTEWGVARGYLRGGFEQITPFNSPVTPAVWWDRGYIEFAGFTIGKQRSFFDIFEPVSNYTYGNPRTNGDTDLYGAIMGGFTYRFGSGASVSVAVEDPGAHDRGGVANMAMGELTLGGLATNNGFAGQGTTANTRTLNGFSMPDIIGNARYDQDWGYLAVSGALHQVAGGYYGGANSLNNFHPEGKIGFAVQAAGKFFIPQLRGDYVGGSFVYSEGAPGYAARNNVWQLYNPAHIIGGVNSAGFAWLPDGVYDNVNPLGGPPNSAIELTTAWSFNGVYEHIWTDQWKTNVYGGYTKVTFNSTATNLINQHLPTPPLGGTACGVPVEGAVAPPIAIGNGVGNSCSPNFSFWQIGSRTQYSPTAWLDLGVDVSWTHLNTAYKGPNATLGANGARPGGLYNIEDQNVFTALGRAQLNFFPGK